VCDDIDNNYGYSVIPEGVYDSADQNPGFEHTKTLCDEVCQWFSPGTPVSSVNKTDRHDIIEILLKVALKTIN
jgi:hypothetical protein